MTHRPLLALALVLLTPTLGACGSAMPRTAPNSAVITEPARPVVAEFYDDEIVVEVTINGTGPYRLQLDTGSSVSCLSPAIAARIGLKPHASVIAVDAHGHEHREPVADAATVRIGGLELHDVPFTINTLPELAIADNGVVGLAGYNLFLSQTLDIDYPNKTVRISNERLPDRGTLPLHLRYGRSPNVLAKFQMPGRGESIETALLIDTGSGAQLSLGRYNAIAYADTAHAVAQGGTISSTGNIRPAMFARLMFDLFLGAPTATKVTALIDSEGPRTDAASIGADLMRHFRVTLDPVAGRARFTHPSGDGPVPMPLRRVHGFAYEPNDDGTINVRSVAEGSPAERGGLREGDRILRIDGAEPIARIGTVTDPAVLTRRFTIERDAQQAELVLGLQELIPEPEIYKLLRESVERRASDTNQDRATPGKDADKNADKDPS